MNTDQSPVGYKELPNEVIKDARFPPTCPVVYDTKAAKNNSSFDIKTGTVQKAYYNAEEEKTLYGIKPNDNNESSQKDLVFRKRKELSFGYNCPVEVYSNGRKEEGNIISPGQCDVDRYDCMFPTKNGYRVVEKIHVDDIKYLPPSTSTPPTEVVVSGNSLTDNQEKEEEDATTDQSLESDSNYSEEESEYDPNEYASKGGNTKQGADYMGSNTKGVYSQNGGKYTSSIRLNYVLFHGGTTTLASDSAHRHDLLNDQLKIPNRQKHFLDLKDYQTARAKEIQERGLSGDAVGSFESARLHNKQAIEAEIAKKMAAKDTAASSAASPQSEVPNERRYIGSQPTHAEEIEKQPAFKPGEDCSFEWNVRRREGESLSTRDSPKRKRDESGHSHPLKRKKDWKHTMANKSMIQR